MSKKIKVIAANTPSKVPTEPFLVYWRMHGLVSNEVHSSHVSHQRDGCIYFTNGGHTYASNCFCTPEQVLKVKCKCVSCQVARAQKKLDKLRTR